jgi:predicted TPR repeat methyltransferase
MCVELAITLAPQSLRAHFRLGNLLFQSGQYEDASMHYQHALALVREQRAVDMQTVAAATPDADPAEPPVAASDDLLPRVLVTTNPNPTLTLPQS